MCVWTALVPMKAVCSHSFLPPGRARVGQGVGGYRMHFPGNIRIVFRSVGRFSAPPNIPEA